jgi:putative endonuclease
MKIAAVYILCSRLGKRRLYLNATADLKKRLWAHKHALPEHYIRCLPNHKLVYFEITEDMYHAQRRKQEIIDMGGRQQICLISGFNPEWRDLCQLFEDDRAKMPSPPKPALQA